MCYSNDGCVEIVHFGLIKTWSIIVHFPKLHCNEDLGQAFQLQMTTISHPSEWVMVCILQVLWRKPLIHCTSKWIMFIRWKMHCTSKCIMCVHCQMLCTSKCISNLWEMHYIGKIIISIKWEIDMSPGMTHNHQAGLRETSLLIIQLSPIMCHDRILILTQFPVLSGLLKR